MVELFVCLAISAPVPHHLMGPTVAPAPREMFPYRDSDGRIRYYSRERIEAGKRVRVIREGDLDHERTFGIAPIPPNGVVPEN